METRQSDEVLLIGSTTNELKQQGMTDAITWHTFVEGKVSRSGINFIEEYFIIRGIQNPTLDDVRKISEDDLLDSYISIPTMKSIMLMQQQIGK